MSARESRPTSGEAAPGNSPVPDPHDTVADHHVGTGSYDPDGSPADILDALGGDVTALDDDDLEAVVRADPMADEGGLLSTPEATAAQEELARRRDEEDRKAAEQIRADTAARLAKAQEARAAAPKVPAAVRTVPEATGDLGDWLRDTPWSEILLRNGWFHHASDRVCGCETYTAPGVHGESKSAVAHECGDHTDGGRLHVWTDHPETPGIEDEVAAGVRDFSKLQFVMHAEHGGDILAALEAEGISPDTAESGGGLLVRTPKVDRAAVLQAQDRVFSTPAAGEVYTLAVSEHMGPFALLGVLLTHLAAALGPSATVEGLASFGAPLTLHTAVVGSSGSGKSSTHKVLARAVKMAVDPGTRREYRDFLLARTVAAMGGEVSDEQRRQLEADADEDARLFSARRLPHGLSTGQGFTAAFADQLVRPVDPFGARMLWKMDEVDALSAQQSQRDAILLPSLNSGWTGDDIGQHNADPSKRRNVPGGKYAYGLVVNVQPARSGPILEGADSGSPQRYLWMPVEVFGGLPPEADEDDTDMFARPEAHRLEVPVLLHKPRRFVMPPSARREYRLQRRAAVTTNAWETGTASHRLLAQAKVAALLEVLEGALADAGDTEVVTVRVSEQTWSRAEDVLTVSDYTRERCHAAVSTVAQEVRRSRGRADHEREAAKAEAAEESITAAGQAIVAWMTKEGLDRAGLSKVRKTALSKKNRSLAERAVEYRDDLRLEDAPRGDGKVVVHEVTDA